MVMDKHRVALVTGGMGGLGEAICIKLAALGYTVVTTYSPGNTKAAEWLDAMKQQGLSFRAYACDVADFESAAACVKKVNDEVGPVDVLVNNAGITRDMTFKKMDKANWDAVIKTNLDSCFNMTKQVCDGMAERAWGRIINISSVGGQWGGMLQVHYACAKAGLNNLTRSLAKLYSAQGVLTNTVAAGLVATDMIANELETEAGREKVRNIPAGRIAAPDDIARAVAFLVSDDASYITGQTINANGGMYFGS